MVILQKVEPMLRLVLVLCSLCGAGEAVGVVPPTKSASLMLKVKHSRSESPSVSVDLVELKHSKDQQLQKELQYLQMILKSFLFLWIWSRFFTRRSWYRFSILVWWCCGSSYIQSSRRDSSLYLYWSSRMPSVLVILDLEVLLRSKDQQLQKELQYLQMIYRYYLPLRDLPQMLSLEVKLVQVLYSDLLVVMSLTYQLCYYVGLFAVTGRGLEAFSERTMLDLLSL